MLPAAPGAGGSEDGLALDPTAALWPVSLCPGHPHLRPKALCLSFSQQWDLVKWLRQPVSPSCLGQPVAWQ